GADIAGIKRGKSFQHKKASCSCLTPIIVPGAPAGSFALRQRQHRSTVLRCLKAGTGDGLNIATRKNRPEGPSPMKTLAIYVASALLLASHAGLAQAQTASAELKPTQGNKTSGTTTFTKQGER